MSYKYPPAPARLPRKPSPDGNGVHGTSRRDYSGPPEEYINQPLWLPTSAKYTGSKPGIVTAARRDVALPLTSPKLSVVRPSVDGSSESDLPANFNLAPNSEFSLNKANRRRRSCSPATNAHLDPRSIDTLRRPVAPQNSKFHTGLNLHAEDLPLSEKELPPAPRDITRDARSLGYRLSTDSALRDPSTIIYRLSCRDLMTQEELIRYSTTPFHGFIDNDGSTRTELAPMDVMLYTRGNKLKDRKSQHRSTFGTNDDPDPEPFVIGKDFFARIIDPTYIRILSPQIQEVLRKIVQYYPGHDLQGKELLFKEPYNVLVHYYYDLHMVAATYSGRDGTVELGSEAEGSLVTIHCDKTTHDHLNILLESPTFKGHYEGLIEPELWNHERGLASYEMLWLLFKPGETVLARVRNNLAGFIVLAADHTPDPYGVSPLDKWTIHVWNLAYTGQRLTRQAHEFTIERYDGLCEIISLNIFPKCFLRDGSKTERELIARGAEYFRIVCGLPAHRRYSGPVIGDHLVQVRYNTHIDAKAQLIAILKYNGEIMVDPSGYLTYAPKRSTTQESLSKSAMRQRGWQPIEKSQIPEDENADFYTHFAKPLDLDGGPRWSKLNDIICKEENMPTEDQLLLFSCHVLGFALQRKEWSKLSSNVVKKSLDVDF